MSVSANSSSGAADPLQLLVPLGFVATIAALWASLLYAPTAAIEGDIQRLLYVHVPAAVAMYGAYGLVFLSSVVYLMKRQSKWDELAAAAAEIGTLYATTVLLTGPVWARIAWGTWWAWDARLTSTLVLWLIYAAYLMLRAYGGDPGQVARYCAVLGIIGFADLPIIHYSVTWWRTLHPQPKIMTEGSAGAGLDPSMLLTAAIASLATMLLFAALLVLRVRLERLGRRAAVARERGRLARPLETTV